MYVIGFFIHINSVNLHFLGVYCGIAATRPVNRSNLIIIYWRVSFVVNRHDRLSCALMTRRVGFPSAAANLCMQQNAEAN